MPPQDFQKPTLYKAPEARLDFQFNWGPWLQSGETITDSAWVAEVGVNLGTQTFTDTTAVAWVTGGTAGQEYILTNTVTTSDDRIDERSMIIAVVNR